MRNNFFVLPVPTSAGPGAAQNARDLTEKYVQVSGTFTAQLAIEGTLDGTNWAPIHSGISAAGWYAIPHPISHLRVNTTSYTSGAPRVVLAGRDIHG